MALRALTLLLLAGCGSPAAPSRPRYERGPGCEIVYTFYVNRVDRSGGVIVVRFRPDNVDDCPDEVAVVWDSVAVTR